MVTALLITVPSAASTRRQLADACNMLVSWRTQPVSMAAAMCGSPCGSAICWWPRITGVQDWRWQDRKKSRHHAPPSLGRPGVVKGSSMRHTVTEAWEPCICCMPCMPVPLIQCPKTMYTWLVCKHM